MRRVDKILHRLRRFEGSQTLALMTRHFGKLVASNLVEDCRTLVLVGEASKNLRDIEKAYMHEKLGDPSELESRLKSYSEKRRKAMIALDAALDGMYEEVNSNGTTKGLGIRSESLVG